MKALELAKATAPLAQYARDLKDPVVLTVEGKPVAALVPIEKVDFESLALGTSAEFLALIERSRARHAREGGISSEEMRRRLGLTRSEKNRASPSA